MLYPKIQTVYFRDPATNNKTLLEGQFSDAAFEYLANAKWYLTEKIDGTNVRVMWDGDKVTFGGRSEEAQMPTSLFQKLQEKFPADLFKGHDSLILFGEGYGAKIQKGGGNYISDGVDFILFDAFYNGKWLEMWDLRDLATNLLIHHVPILGTATLLDGVEMVKKGFTSTIANTPAEGLVMRPIVVLADRYGKRIISKIKHRDFA